MLLPFETILTNPYRIYVTGKGFVKTRRGNIVSRILSDDHQSLDNLSSLAKISHLIAQ